MGIYTLSEPQKAIKKDRCGESVRGDRKRNGKKIHVGLGGTGPGCQCNDMRRTCGQVRRYDNHTQRITICCESSPGEGGGH